MTDTDSLLDSQFAESRGPVCAEGDVLIVEVMGTGHPDPCRLELYDQSGSEPLSDVEAKVREERHDWQSLHIWPWEQGVKGQVWLEMDAEAGEPIRVPLIREATVTPTQLGPQLNRVWPVVPLTLLYDGDPLPGHPREYPVPLRPGFLYVFRDGRLWRELEVDTADSGQPVFRDIRLADYRQNAGPGLTKDRRPAVGQPLTSIWLPIRGMGRALEGEFELAFCDVQWSAQRVGYLETNPTARSARCDRWRGPAPEPGRHSPPPNWTRAPGNMAPLNALEPMRAREPLLEYRLHRPWEQVYSLDGRRAHTLFQQAVDEAAAYRKGGANAASAWEAANYRDATLRHLPAVRAAAFLSVHDRLEEGERSLWQPLDASEDVLAGSRDRHYATLLVDDRTFRIRHHATQSLEAHRFLTMLLETAAEQDHAESAQLVRRVMVPSTLNGRENPLHEYLKHIDTGYFGPLHRTLLTAQRQLAVEEVADSQRRLVTLMKQAPYQDVLADLFGLTGADYIEGFRLCSDLFQVLAADPNGMDTLACRGDTPVSRDQIRDAHELLVSIIEEGSTQPLHRMLFPSEAPEDLQAADAESFAGGDGQCRPADLERLPERLPTEDEVQTLTAATLLGLVKQPELNLVTELKRWAAVVNAILDGLDKYARVLIGRLKSRTLGLNARVYGPLLRLAKARAPSLMGSVQLVARNAIPQGWVLLGVSDPEAGLRYGLTQADREYVHKTNGHRRFYGEILDAEGNPLATTRKSSLPDPGDTPEVRNVRVYAAPADSKVVRASRDLRLMKAWQDALETIRFPYLVLAVEVSNIRAESASFNSLAARKGRLRALGGAASATFDLFFASIMAAEKITKDVGFWSGFSEKLSSQAVRMNKTVVSHASKTLARVLPEVVSYRLLGGLIAGGLTITVSILDFAHEWDTGDADAALGHAASALGGGALLMGGLMMAKTAEAGIAPVLLGLGPWGWVALGVTLAIGGGVFAILADDPPLVDWLKFGPFGEEQDDAYPYLRDQPVSAFHRLAGLLSKPRITVAPMRDAEAMLAGEGYVTERHGGREYADINARVRVENNLAGLLEAVSLTTHMRPVLVTRESSPRGQLTQRRLAEKPAKIVLRRPLMNGMEYFLALPPRDTFRRFLGQEAERFSEVAVRAQWHGRFDFGHASHDLAFPTPELENDLAYALAKHAQPDFKAINRPFWADEQTHHAEEER